MNSNDMELLNNMTSIFFNFSDHQDVEPDQLPIPAGAVNDHNVENTFYPNHPQFYDNSYECNNMRPVENLTNSVPLIDRLIGGEKANRSDNHRGRKRKRNNEREAEKPKEVVHVRAKRGQATDSHSLAERLRREKINEKLRSLQDLVPGCYKTMGMAVMLDVIINYVRSLQNQIEFLSMKLSAASLFYDFNSSEMDALETMQGTNGHETQVMEMIVGDGYGGPGVPQFQSWPL